MFSSSSSSANSSNFRAIARFVLISSNLSRLFGAVISSFSLFSFKTLSISLNVSCVFTTSSSIFLTDGTCSGISSSFVITSGITFSNSDIGSIGISSIITSSSCSSASSIYALIISSVGMLSLIAIIIHSSIILSISLIFFCFSNAFTFLSYKYVFLYIFLAAFTYILCINISIFGIEISIFFCLLPTLMHVNTFN